MSILPGYKKYRKYKQMKDGFQLQSVWTSSTTVEREDGKTVEENLNELENPDYTLSPTLSELQNKESYKTAFGKIAKAVSVLMDHIKIKTISLTGDVTGSVEATGSDNITINTSVEDDSHNHTASTLPSASSSEKGITTLTDSVSSTSVNSAATPNSVKQVYDKTVSIETTIDNNINNWNDKYTKLETDDMISDLLQSINENGNGNTSSMELTQTEYDNLTESEKLNGIVYYITDGNVNGNLGDIVSIDVQDNLTSEHNTTDPLSAHQGYLLANGYARDDSKLSLDGGVLNDNASLNLNGSDGICEHIQVTGGDYNTIIYPAYMEITDNKNYSSHANSVRNRNLIHVSSNEIEVRYEEKNNFDVETVNKWSKITPRAIYEDGKLLTEKYHQLGTIDYVAPDYKIINATTDNDQRAYIEINNDESCPSTLHAYMIDEGTGDEYDCNLTSHNLHFKHYDTENTKNTYYTSESINSNVDFYINLNNVRFYFNAKPLDNIYEFRTNMDGKCNLGTNDYSWNNIYSKTGVIQTSDRNEKKDINELSASLCQKIIDGLIPVSYKFINNESDRTHYGLISQDVETLLDDLGISSKDFAGFVKTPKKENNNEYDYALRYEEFIAPMIKVIQDLRKEVDDLKEANYTRFVKSI